MPKKGQFYMSTTWKDCGDNLPAVVQITYTCRQRECIYYKTVRMYDGLRWDLGNKYYATPEYFLSHYYPMTQQQFKERLQYRQQELSPLELQKNLSRKLWLSEHSNLRDTVEKCYTSEEGKEGKV